MENQRADKVPGPPEDAERQAHAATPADDDLLGVIADVERQLSSLRTYRAQAEEARARWQAAEAELRRRGVEVEEHTKRIAGERDDLSQAQRKLQDLDVQLRARSEKIDRDFESLAEEQRRAAQAAERRETDLAARSATLEQREKRLAEHTASVSRHRETVQALETQIAERERAIAETFAELQRREQEFTELRSRAAAAEKLASDRTADLARAQEEARDHAKRADSLSRTGEEAKSAHERAIASLKAEIARAGEAQSELIASLSERERRIEQAGEKLKQSADEAKRHASAAQESESRTEDFKRQVIERDTRIQDLSRKLAAATTKLREVSQSLQEQAHLIGEGREMEAELERRAERIADLERQVVESGSRLSGDEEGGGVPDAAHSAEREALEQRAQELEEQLRATQARLEEALSASDERAEGTEATGSTGHLGGAEIPSEVGEAIVTRWRRLRTMRTILREQAEKLRHASEALRARYESSGNSSADRETLARERAALAEARQRLEKQRGAPAKSKSAVASVSYGVLAATALAGLSWAVAGQVAPALYEARVVIAADTKTQAAAPDQLAEWQRYHESLLKDPALVDMAAERMGRRGIASLSSPGLLQTRLNADMSTSAPGEGKLALALRGRGASETTRALDTYATALVSQANANREHRSDGLSTVIVESPNAGAGPIEDERFVYALGIFACGCVVSVAGGGLAMRRIAGAKERFEQEQTDELQPEDWNRPPQNYSRG